MLVELLRRINPCFQSPIKNNKEPAELDELIKIQEKIQTHIISNADSKTLWGNYLYEADITLEENILQAIEDGHFNSVVPVTFADLNFRIVLSTIEAPRSMKFPANIVLRNCRLTAGELIFEHGTLFLDGRSTIGTACGDGAIINAVGDDTMATVYGMNSEINLLGARSIGNAKGAFSHVYARGPDSVANAYAKRSSGHAHGEHSQAHAMGFQTQPTGHEPNVKAFAWGLESSAIVEEAGGIGYAEGIESTVYVQHPRAFGVLNSPIATVKAKSNDVFLISTMSDMRKAKGLAYYDEYWRGTRDFPGRWIGATQDITPIDSKSILDLRNGQYKRLKLEAEKGIPAAQEWLDKLVPSRFDRIKLALEYKRRSIFEQPKT